jgi:hypothetical protein
VTAPTPDFQQTAFLMFMIGLGALLAILASAASIWKNMRTPPRTPPSEEKALETFATKNDLATFRCEMQTSCRLNHQSVDKVHTDIFNLIRASQSENRTMMEALHKDLNLWQLGVERQIGHIEGKLANEPD